MAKYKVLSEGRINQNGAVVILRQGDEVSDTEYSISALRANGILLQPVGSTELDAQAAQSVANRQRGAYSDEHFPSYPVGVTPMRSGKVTISASATTSAVAFTGAEKDTNYRIELTTGNPSAGSPATGSLNAYWTSKATSGFTINLVAAPGGSDTVDVDWVVVRT